MSLGEGIIIIIVLAMLWKDLRELRKARAERKQAERELEKDKARLAEARAEMDSVMQDLKVEVGKHEMARCGGRRH